MNIIKEQLGPLHKVRSACPLCQWGNYSSGRLSASLKVTANTWSWDFHPSLLMPSTLLINNPTQHRRQCLSSFWGQVRVCSPTLFPRQFLADLCLNFLISSCFILESLVRCQAQWQNVDARVRMTALRTAAAQGFLSTFVLDKMKQFPSTYKQGLCSRLLSEAFLASAPSNPQRHPAEAIV